jgi:phosphohistidine phosphatase
MKFLVLGRHSDADYDFSGNDYDRPLADKGEAHLLTMQVRLRERLNGKSLAIICSGAARTTQTAQGYAEELSIAQDSIIRDTELYGAGNGDYLDRIKTIPDSINTVIMVGHNPTIPSLATYLSGEHMQGMPACGYVGIEFKTDTWQKIDTENGSIKFFDYPKH